MSAITGDEEKSLKSTASSETLVSIGASAATVSRQTWHPAQDSFYERTTPEDDEVSALDQWLQTPSDRRYHDSAPLDLSHRTNRGAFRNHVYHSLPWTSRFEDQDAIPHPSHRNNRTIVGKPSPPYKPPMEYPTVMSAVRVSEERPMYRLIVLGDKGVGKRSFTIQVSIPLIILELEVIG